MKRNFCDLAKAAEPPSEALRLAREDGLKAGREEGASMIKKLRDEAVDLSGKKRDQAAELRHISSNLQAVRADRSTVQTERNAFRAECVVLREARRQLISNQAYERTISYWRGIFRGKEKTVAENPGLSISFSHVPSNLPPEVTEAGEDEEVPPWGEERVNLSGDSDSSF